MEVRRILCSVYVWTICTVLTKSQIIRRPSLAIGQWCNCDSEYKPVCGSDGMTYINDCHLYCASSDGGQNGRECIRYKDGRDYKGQLATTEDGRRCTPWENNVGIYPLSDEIQYDPITASNFPDRSLQQARNYCRNPDKDPRGLWCFTGNGDPYSHGACSVPSCGNNNRECISTRDGSDYAGRTATTTDGRRCTPWINNVGIYPRSYETPVDPINDRNFPDGSVLSASNYCRNPDKDDRGPWCFTGYGELYNYGFCSIPRCPDNNRDLYKLHDGACSDDNCRDDEDYERDCRDWKSYGFCETRRQFMSSYCRRTCGFCNDQDCRDSFNYRDRCPAWAQRGHCRRERTFMYKNCKRSCGWCDIQECEDNSTYTLFCPHWARVGFCSTRRDAMMQYCRKSCDFC